MRYTLLIIIGLAQQLTAQVPPVFDSLQAYFSTTIYFDSDVAELDAAALQTLEACPAPSSTNDRLYLTGHTDAVGSNSYNEALAIRRATSAKTVLLEKAWPDSSMIIQTFGERTPVANNDLADGRRKNRRVTLDFYRAVPYRTISGQVLDPVSQEPILNSMIRIHARSFSDTIRPDENGQFTVALPIDTVVGIEAYAKGYFLESKMLKMRPKTIPQLKLELQEAKAGAVADIEELFFVGNEAILLPRSEPVLPKILRFMEINSHLRIEIAGHVNYPDRPPVTKDTFEWDLSVRRAKLVYDYLIDNGVHPDLLQFKGYGNHEMRFPKARSAEDQEANRRVEIRVLEVIQN